MVDFGAVAAAYARDIEAHGGEIRRGAGVRALVEREDRVEAVLADGTVVAAARAVACAGAWSDRLALASGARPDVRIVPFRGAYLQLRPERADLVRGQIYPVPDPALPFLGVHLSRTIAGERADRPDRAARARATSDLRATLRWPGTWRVDARAGGGPASPRSPTRSSRRLLVREAARFVPAIGTGDVSAGPRGFRAQAVGRDGALVDDFLLAAPGAPCTCSTRRRPPPRPRWRSPRLIARSAACDLRVALVHLPLVGGRAGRGSPRAAPASRRPGTRAGSRRGRARSWRPAPGCRRPG